MTKTRASARLDFLQALYIPQLLAKGPDSGWPEMGAHDIFTALRRTDPSHNSRYLERLLKWTLQGTLRKAELSRMHEVLRVFEATNDMLPADRRDINRYATGEEMIETVLGKALERVRRLIEADETHDRYHQVWLRPNLYKRSMPIEQKAMIGLSYLLHNDPRCGRNLGHILRWMENIDEALLPEDMTRIQDELTLYHKYRQRLSPDRRDIATYKSWSDLQNAVIPYLKLPRFSASELRVIEDHDIAMGRAVEVAEGDKWRLLQIKTQEGAISLGRGTQFCTSFTGSRRNYFPYYTEGLLYLRDSEGKRHQLHFPTFQFRDVRDREVDDPQDLVDQHRGLSDALVPYAILSNFGQGFLAMDNQKYHFEGFKNLCRIYRLGPAVTSAAAAAIPTLLVQCMTPKSKIRTGAIVGIDADGNEIGNMETRMMAHLMMTCRDVPEWRAAAETVIDRVIPCLMLEIADPEYNNNFVIELMDHYKGIPKWESVFRAALPRTCAEAKRRKNPRFIENLAEACARNPALLGKTHEQLTNMVPPAP